MLNRNVSIGVVIPYCNDIEYIEECLTSIDAQTVLADIHVYLVDDASHDSRVLSSLLSVLEFQKISVTYVRNEERMGGGESRNIGIRLSEDDYIAFMDADDFWLNKKLEIQLDKYKEGSVLSTRTYKGASLKQAVQLPRRVKESKESVSEALFCANKLLQTSTFFMSANVAKNIMFNPQLPRHQDYDFLLRAEHNGNPVIQIDQALSFWRVVDSSTSRFLKKNANAEFFINWYLEYHKFMSTKARVAYCSKNIFSACFVTKEIGLYIKFLIELDDSLHFKFKVMLGILTWRFTKLWRKLFL